MFLLGIEQLLYLWCMCFVAHKLQLQCQLQSFLSISCDSFQKCDTVGAPVPNYRPMSIVAKRLVQDGTWHHLEHCWTDL